jgi:flagellin
LGVQHENLTASESQIRDVDMAAEMVTFTRNQILQQAGVAVLSQANAMPQSVLQLLR